MIDTTAGAIGPVIVGKVSDRDTARDHLDILGRAHCGAGFGLIDADTRWEIDGTVEASKVCRRCLKALRRALAEAAAAGHVAAGDAAYMLTPPARAAERDDALAADLLAFHTQLAAQREPAPLDPFHADKVLAQLRAELAGEESAALLIA